ncbi:hypothetical protein McpSp1_10680 [Methanocorpusculaceae archaeon Sp1]|nr:hypothetical protein [Methanocorpusculaceae archaeon Sp1]
MTDDTDSEYHHISYHCADCGMVFDIGGWVPEEKLPTEPILLCPKCSGPALRTDADQSLMLGKFIELRTRATELLFTRMHEAGLLRRPGSQQKQGKGGPA